MKSLIAHNPDDFESEGVIHPEAARIRLNLIRKKLEISSHFWYVIEVSMFSKPYTTMSEISKVLEYQGFKVFGVCELSMSCTIYSNKALPTGNEFFPACELSTKI